VVLEFLLEAQRQTAFETERSLLSLFLS